MFMAHGDDADFLIGFNVDNLESASGQRHHGALLTLARRFWPRG
jgi:hypothetical protein